jgi:signal transduction histidine kinase
MSLYQRLALSICIAFTLLASLLFYWSNSLAEQSKYQAEQQLHLKLAEHLANDNPLLQDGVYNKKALENLFHTLMLLGPAFEFYFLDPEGKILTYSADANKIKRQFVNLSPLKSLIDNPEKTPIFGDDPRSLQNKKIFSTSPIYQGDNLQGYLYVIIGGEIYDSIFSQVKNDAYLQQYGTFILIALMLLMIILLTIFRFFTAPIRVLAAQMQALKDVQFDQNKVNLTKWGRNKSNKSNNENVKSGNLAYKKDNNEVHFLGNTFNDMVGQINVQFDQLTENDRTRRELLAHLSHDLRTPLATMQGYVEILSLKSEQLSSDEKDKYLTIVQRNLSQLKRLIDQIFELAHLENGQITVNLETFSIGELLHDILAKFALKAKEKGLTLQLEPKQCRLNVYSDIAKLERIMTNLIENAIRHTENGGQITITIGESQDKVQVSVSDTGSGISKEDIAYIFDARYRASNAVEDKTHHAGLGLAITQKLSAILQAELIVNSELGHGSCFSLSLPIKSSA